MKTAGDNHAQRTGFVIEDGAGTHPVEACSRAAAGGCSPGIEVDCIHAVVTNDGTQLVAEFLLRLVGIAIHQPVQCLNQKQFAAEFLAQLLCEKPIEIAMQLDPIQSGSANGEGNLVEAVRTKDADLFEAGWQTRRNGRDLARVIFRLLRAKMNPRHPRHFGSQLGVFEIGVAADLDPHGSAHFREAAAGPAICS